MVPLSFINNVSKFTIVSERISVFTALSTLGVKFVWRELIQFSYCMSYFVDVLGVPKGVFAALHHERI